MLTIRKTTNDDFLAILGYPQPDVESFYFTVCKCEKPISIAGIGLYDGVWWFTHNYIPHNESVFNVFKLSCVIVQLVADMGLDVITRTSNQHKKYVEKLGFYFVCEDSGDLIYRLAN